MKTIMLSAMLLLSGSSLFAQFPKKITTTTTKSTSVSLRNSDSDYNLSASFTNGDSMGLDKIISDVLGSGVKSGTNDKLWQIKNVYEVMLSAKKITIELNKDKASGSLSKSIINLGKDIEQSINKDHPTPKTPAN